MAVQDHVGRIEREAWVVSTGLFLGFAVIGVIGRFVVRFGIQKSRFQLEDALLTLAFMFLLASQIIMYYKIVDPMYLTMAIQFGVEGVEIPANVLEIGIAFHKWSITALLLGWFSISTVKFFFLVFFKRLIDRLRPWQIYWWIVFVYNVILLAFGITQYFTGCPYWGPKTIQSESGTFKTRLIRYAVAIITMDILGDVLILVIPIGIIWNVKVTLRQKLVLACSLCLTIVLVALTVTRVAGLKYKGSIDQVWETFWQCMSAELGVFLAAASAFRGFFVSQKQNKAYTPPYRQGSSSLPGKGLMRSDERKIESSSDVGSDRRIEDRERDAITVTSSIEVELPSIPRDHITDRYSGYKDCSSSFRL